MLSLEIEAVYGCETPIAMRPDGNRQNLVTAVQEPIILLVALPVRVFNEIVYTQIDGHFWPPRMRTVGPCELNSDAQLAQERVLVT